MRVLLADDHELVREGVADLLRAEADVQLVGQARDGREAVQLAAELNPDVLVMDVNMPTMDGLEATRALRDRRHETRVILLTHRHDTQLISQAFEAGIHGFVSKSSGVDDLVEAIRKVHQGGRYISPEMRDTSAGQRRQKHEPIVCSATLTQREREVLVMIAEGLTTKQIASSLSISEATVSAHKRNVMGKIEAKTVADATRFALREGLVNLAKEATA